MASILHLTQNMEEELPRTNLPHVLARPHQSQRLSQLAVVPIVDVVTPVVAPAVVVVSPTSAVHVGV
jgi:hypothetical protein